MPWYSCKIITNSTKLVGPSWPWSYGSLIYYLCNQCLSQLMRVWILIRARCTTLCDKVCQSLATGRSFPTPINLTATISLKYCWKWYDIAGKLLKCTSFQNRKMKCEVWFVAILLVRGKVLPEHHRQTPSP